MIIPLGLFLSLLLQQNHGLRGGGTKDSNTRTRYLSAPISCVSEANEFAGNLGSKDEGLFYHYSLGDGGTDNDI